MKTLTWPQVIGRRLMRNHLVSPAPSEQLADVVRDTCGIQAQVPAAAELGISARVANITRQGVREALSEERTLVRTNGPRSTKHILPADELPLWTAAMRAGSALQPAPTPRPSIDVAEAAVLLRHISEALDGLVLTREELADRVARRGGSRLHEPLMSPWGELLEKAFEEGVLVHGPAKGGNTTFARADQWLGSSQEMDPTESLTEICRRFIRTYGLVTHQDFARWFGIEREASHNLFESVRSDLEEVKIDRRRAWVLASEAESSWEPVEGMLRLVPQYDCYILGSYPRPPIVPEGIKTLLSTLDRANYEGAVGLSLLLLDGVVSGIWQRRQRGKRLEVTVTPIVVLTAAQREQLEAEANRLAAFLSTEVTLSHNPPR